MQNAATGTGNGTAITVDYFQTVSVEVTISATATITWEESITGLNWNTGSCVNASAPSTVVTTATTSGLYHCGLSALTQFRARISSYGSGTVTAYARITTLDFNKIRASGSPSSMVVTQPTGTNLHIVCDSGCGGAASFTDNSAFTFNTTAINNMGAVVDDTATNTVTENSSGVPRMSANRILYSAPTTAGGTAFSMNTGVRDAGTQRVTIATNDVVPASQSGSWTVTTTPPSNASTNLAQVAGTTTDTNSGVKSAGTMRVVLATDQPQLTNKLLVTPDSVALPANQSVNTAQFGGTNVSTGTGAGGAGIPRVTISNDSSLAANQSVNLAQVGGTNTVNGGLAGSLSIGGTAANNAAINQNPILIGCETIAQGSQPTAATAANQRRTLCTTEGSQFVQEGSSNRFSCFVQAVTATTQCQAAPGAGLRAYVTSMAGSNQAATVQTLDVVFGTGTNCATGTTALTHKWQMGTNATTTSPQDIEMSFTTPLVPTAANAICVRPSAATAFGATLTGYIAP